MLKTRAKMQAEITAVSQVKTRGHGHSEPGRYHSAAEALGVVEDARTERREAGKKGRLTVRSLSRVWQEAVADNYEGMTGAITQRQGLLLRSYATVYAARGDGGFEVFSRYVQWVIGNWTAVVAARLYWMDSKPDRPDAGVFCSTSLRGHFESAYRDRQKVEAHRGLTRRESYKLEHVQAGKEAAEAERLTVAKFGAEEQLADLQDMTARMQEAFAALSRGLSTEEAQEQRQGRYRALQGRMEAYTAKYGGTPLEEQLELLRKLGGETKA